MDNETTKVTAEAASIIFDNASSISNAMMGSFSQGAEIGFQNGFKAGAVWGGCVVVGAIAASAVVANSWPRVNRYIKSKFNKD